MYFVPVEARRHKLFVDRSFVLASTLTLFINREAIGEVAVRANGLEGDSRAGVLWRARLYLERYFYLIAFAAYLLDGTALTFSDWLRLHPEIDGILAKGTSLKN